MMSFRSWEYLVRENAAIAIFNFSCLVDFYILNETITNSEGRTL